MLGLWRGHGEVCAARERQHLWACNLARPGSTLGLDGIVEDLGGTT